MADPILKIILHDLFKYFESHYHEQSHNSDTGLLTTSASSINALYQGYVGRNGLFPTRNLELSGKKRVFATELKEALLLVPLDSDPNKIADYQNALRTKILVSLRTMPQNGDKPGTSCLDKTIEQLQKAMDRIFIVWNLIPKNKMLITDEERDQDAFYIFLQHLTSYFALHQFDTVFSPQLAEEKFAAFCERVTLLLQHIKDDPRLRAELILVFINDLSVINTNLASTHYAPSNGTFSTALEETRSRIAAMRTSPTRQLVL